MKEKKQKEVYTQIGQKAIIFDPLKKKFLLVKAREGHFMEKRGAWELVGGRINREENIANALEHEIQEEVGDKIGYVVKNIVAMSEPVLTTQGNYIVLVGYFVEYSGGEITLSDEHEEYRWETAEEISKNKEYGKWLKNFIKKAQEYDETKEAMNGWKRCVADFDNFKKRQAEERKDFIQFATTDLIAQILPVVDNFHASTDHIPQDHKKDPWVIGIMHIQTQLEKVLMENGISAMAVKVGDTFNPERMEAVEETANNKQQTNDGVEKKEKEKSDRDEKEQKVKRVIQRGYQIKERVIRPTRVVVE